MASRSAVQACTGEDLDLFICEKLFWGLFRTLLRIFCLFLLSFLGVSLFWHCIGTGSFVLFFASLLSSTADRALAFLSLLANVNVPVFSHANIFLTSPPLRLVWPQYLELCRFIPSVFLLYRLLAGSCFGGKGGSMYFSLCRQGV